MAGRRAKPTEPSNEVASEVPVITREPGDDSDERKYPPEANPRPWAHNNDAGVEFRTHRDPYEAELAFRDKPSQAVIDCVKDNGFRWNGQEKIWTRPIGYETRIGS